MMRLFIIFYLFVSSVLGASLCPNKCRCSEEKERRTFSVNCFGTGFDSLPDNISTNVTVLQLPFNKIKNISNQMFSSYKNLQHLVLSHNEVQTVDKDAFDGLNKLVRLDLSGNLIVHFPWSFIRATPKLSILKLDNNFLTNFPSGSEVDNLNQLQSLRIHNNTFKCSCNVFEFSKWFQNNQKRVATGSKYITIQNARNLNCSTRLKWKIVRLLDIPLILSQPSSIYTGKYKCIAPTIEMFSITTSGVEEPLSRKRRDAVITTTSNETKTESSSLIEPADLLAMMLQSPLARKIHHNKSRPAAKWMLDDLEEIIFSVMESMQVKLICDVTNKHLLTEVNQFLLKIISVEKDTNEENIHNMKNWTTANEFIIHKAEYNVHDGIRVICIAENIANTVAQVARIKVVKSNDKTTMKTGIHSTTTDSILVNYGDVVTTRNREQSNSHQTTKLMSLAQSGTPMTSTHVNQGESFSTDSSYNSTCSNHEDYSDLVIKMIPNFQTDRTIHYRYNFNHGVNLTMQEDVERREIRVGIYAKTSTLETMFICSSDENISRKWTVVKKGTEIHYLELFYKQNGTICVSSSNQRIEVCGQFPMRVKVEKSMTLMLIVGFNLLFVPAMLMILFALHRVYFGKSFPHYKPAKLRRRKMANAISKTICENVEIKHKTFLNQPEENESEPAASAGHVVESESNEYIASEFQSLRNQTI